MHLWCSAGGCGYLDKLKKGKDIELLANTTYYRIVQQALGSSKHFKELMEMD